MQQIQAHQEGGVGGSYPALHDVWGAPPSVINIKYTRMHHFEEKFKNFLP